MTGEIFANVANLPELSTFSANFAAIGHNFCAVRAQNGPGGRAFAGKKGANLSGSNVPT
ncbi:MAG: hypothetical protein ACJA06_001122 [Halocynthiibacter sp.]